MLRIEQIKAARALLRMKQSELAQKAGVSISTLNNIERGVQTDPKTSTMRAIRQALEVEGIEFTLHESGDIGLFLKSSERTKTKTKILIIDDSTADRLLYKAWLAKHPHRTMQFIEADNAKDGLNAFLKHKPDCIILDFKMYGTDGFQLLVNMKQKVSIVPPIIFVTGMHNPVVEKAVRGHGVNAYFFKKDLSKEKLCAAIDSVLL